MAPYAGSGQSRCQDRKIRFKIESPYYRIAERYIVFSINLFEGNLTLMWGLQKRYTTFIADTLWKKW